MRKPGIWNSWWPWLLLVAISIPWWIGMWWIVTTILDRLTHG